MTHPVPHITYFDIRGRAEPIRLMLEELNQPYEESRVPSREAWAEMKSGTPFGALPIYREGELVIAQSQAVFRHIARTRGLYGRDEREHVECDVGAEAVSEALEMFWRFFWDPDHQAKSARFAQGPFGTQLRNLERWLTRNAPAPHHWVGAGLTYTDCLAFCLLDEVDARLPLAWVDCPALRAFHGEFVRRPRIASYIASGRRPAAFGYCIDGLKMDPRIGR